MIKKEKNLTIDELLKSGSGITINVTAEQLKEAFICWSEENKVNRPAEAPIQEEEYLDVVQAAKFLNTSTSSIRRWSAAGNFPKRFRGRKIYFWKSDLVRYMSEAA